MNRTRVHVRDLKEIERAQKYKYTSKLKPYTVSGFLLFSPGQVACLPGPSRLAKCLEEYIGALTHCFQSFSLQIKSIKELCYLFVISFLLSFSLSLCRLYVNPPLDQSVHKSLDRRRTQ